VRSPLAAEAEQRFSLAATPLIASSVLPLWLQAFRATHALVEPAVPVEFFAVSMKGRLKTVLVSGLVEALGAHFRELANQVGGK